MPDDLTGIATKLHAARAAAIPLGIAPDGVTSLGDAYAVQAELIRLGGGVRGWKVTAMTPDAQARFGARAPVAGALVPGHVHRLPCELVLSDFVAPLIECEIAVLLGSDLPPRAEPYRRAEVEAAIAAILPAFELPDGRVPAEAPELCKLADAMSNGSFVSGRPVETWRGLDLAHLPIELFLDEEPVARGTGGMMPGGDPVAAVLALANAYPLPAELRAGHVVTTGTCTPPLPVRPGTYRATFGELGAVTVRVIRSRDAAGSAPRPPDGPHSGT